MRHELSAIPRAVEPTVIAVVVTAGTSAYLLRTLGCLSEQERAPDVTLIVDIASPDGALGSGEPIEEVVHQTNLDSVTAVRVVRAPGAQTFGLAVASGLDEYSALVRRALERRRSDAHSVWRGVTGEMSPVTSTDRAVVGHLTRRQDASRSGGPSLRPSNGENSWLWLLHDDSAPDAQALAALLRETEHARTVAVAGCKQRDWSDTERILEVGLSATRTARRFVGLDEDEIDQGQHDHRSDVLAVGTAGMLVRGDVWESVGGLDPLLGPFGDGLEFCRRVRLAGHRVIVVPQAAVYHARASFEGLRQVPAVDAAPRHRAASAAHRPDRRRSFRARRIAQMYNALLAAPAAFLPLLLVGYVVAAPVRSFARLLGKSVRLAWDEVAAVGALLRRLSAVRDARQRLRRCDALTPRDLVPLQTTAAQIRAAQRESRRHRSALRSIRSAPSELEARERAALTAQRRRWLALTCLVTVGAGVLLSGRLVGTFPTGGAIEALPATLSQLWHDARATWIPSGLGSPGPADPLLQVLAVFSAPGILFGLAPSTSMTLILVFAPVAAGLGAWYAAGAATRRASVRAWAALLWAASPTMVLALAQGRIGAALAAAALPWVCLSVCWATGARRRDLLLPGLVGAQRRRRRAAPGPKLAEAPRRLDVFADLLEEGEDVETVGAGYRPGGSALPQPSQAPPEVQPHDAAPSRHGSGHNRTVSLMAAAGGGLALSIATAGVPVLLPAAVLCLALVAIVAAHGRRYLALIVVPPLALHLPLLLHVLFGGGSWRALISDTGRLLATSPPDWLVALGWPQDLTLAGPGLLATWMTPNVLTLVVFGWAALVALALLALAHGGSAAWAVRAGWILVVIGVVTAVVLTHVLVGVGVGVSDASVIVPGWAGGGALLVTAGLLIAVCSADGARHEARAWIRYTQRNADLTDQEEAAHARATRRRALVWAAVCLVGLMPLASAGTLIASAATTDNPAVTGRGSVVPALSQQLATGPEAARTLVISLTEDTLTARLLRHDGRLFTEFSTMADAARIPVAAGAETDPFGTELRRTAARLVGGETDQVAQDLGRAAIGVVVVPPAGSTAASSREHDNLVSRVDAIPGLERVTVNPTGTVWRVADAAAGGAESISRATIRSADGELLADVASDRIDVRGQLPDGEEGRVLALAERADAGWRATVDGQELRAHHLEDGRQAFDLPAHGGTVAVTHTAPGQPLVAVLQLLVFAVAGIMAFPMRRGRDSE